MADYEIVFVTDKNISGVFPMVRRLGLETTIFSSYKVARDYLTREGEEFAGIILDIEPPGYQIIEGGKIEEKEETGHSSPERRDSIMRSMGAILKHFKGSDVPSYLLVSPALMNMDYVKKVIEATEYGVINNYDILQEAIVNIAGIERTVIIEEEPEVAPDNNGLEAAVVREEEKVIETRFPRVGSVIERRRSDSQHSGIDSSVLVPRFPSGIEK